jgi:hypothetical protein
MSHGDDNVIDYKLQRSENIFQNGIVEEEIRPFEEKLVNYEKLFDGGIAEVMTKVLHPPKDLRVEKRGIFACLGLGTFGFGVLAWLKADWQTCLLYTITVIACAILIGMQRETNG